MKRAKLRTFINAYVPDSTDEGVQIIVDEIHDVVYKGKYSDLVINPLYFDKLAKMRVKYFRYFHEHRTLGIVLENE